MARIRLIEINNFRGIQSLLWHPSPGVNCLIGPGDSGKSTVLDAIDLCIGARRTVQFADSDFHGLDVSKPISITVTIGDLSDDLKSMEAYGLYLRGYDDTLGWVEDEPSAGTETALTINLTVASDLEPVWSLISERAAAQGQTRNLAWADRVRIAPTRLGAYADHNLGWRRGSVLNLLSDERPDASVALVQAARDARASFGQVANDQLQATLSIVEATANDLGIPFGSKLQAMLDAHSVSFSGGTISLHSEDGVPMRALGVGSTRLLIAGLQRKAASEAAIVLVDELEHGLEPHRVTRLLGSLGAKEQSAPLQVFVTTHSPAAVRELDASQLRIVRPKENHHTVLNVPTTDHFQATLRLYPEAVLAPRVVVCEGASEVGLLRGLDHYRWDMPLPSLAAMGVALVDGGGIDKVFDRAKVFTGLGYRTAVLRDDDKKPADGLETAFIQAGGKVTAWRDGRALEDELFLSLSDAAIANLLAFAIDLHGEELVDAHIRTASQGACSLVACRAPFNPQVRTWLGLASRTRKAGWFKSVTWMEEAARQIVGPDLQQCDQGFSNAIYELFAWMEDGGA